MTNTPLTDIVSNQYARWMYPQPILDLPAWLSNNWQWFDPYHAHRMFWPDRDYNPQMDILIAGCGTNQAAVLAYTNPQARVVAIDVSQPSLDHHQYLKDKYRMENLELHLLPIEDVASLKSDFDLIISTGVLHHLANPEVGMNALGQCLKPDGVIALMLYAEFGRIGVEMLQGVFRDMGLRQNDASVLMVRDALASLPDGHPIKSYVSVAPDLQYDAALVDTFLHGRDRSYNVRDCMDLVGSAGLVFQDIFLKTSYYPPQGASSTFYSSVALLPEENQWSIMERVNFRNACHFFTACRADRPQQAYKIDFSSNTTRDYIPSFRHRCELRGNEVVRFNHSMTLDAVNLALIMQMDGARSITQIVEAVTQANLLMGQDQGILELAAISLFKALWQLDYVAMRVNAIPETEADTPRKRQAVPRKTHERH